MAATKPVNPLARRTRAWMPCAAISLILVGSAAGLLGTPAAVAAPPPASATPGTGRFVPHPGTSSFLNGLACASPASCWAVGGYDNISGAALNQALHWNARKWSLVTMPSPGGTAKDGFSELMGVACPSSVSCWAVGLYGNGTGATPNQALHWNGRKWSLVTAPSPGSTAGGDFSELIGVRCSSLANC